MGMAARVNDTQVCPKVEPGPTPHVGGPIQSPGEPTVVICGQAAARVGDKALCSGCGMMATIQQGSSSVFIGGKAAARMGDPTDHGGQIVLGAPTVMIGG